MQKNATIYVSRQAAAQSYKRSSSEVRRKGILFEKRFANGANVFSDGFSWPSPSACLHFACGLGGGGVFLYLVAPATVAAVHSTNSRFCLRAT